MLNTSVIDAGGNDGVQADDMEGIFPARRELLVMEKFSSEPRFESQTPRTECSIPFNVRLGP